MWSPEPWFGATGVESRRKKERRKIEQIFATLPNASATKNLWVAFAK